MTYMSFEKRLRQKFKVQST